MPRRLSLVLTALIGLAAVLTGTVPAAAAGAVTVRGGDTLYSSSFRCRVAFNAHQGTAFYGLLPGHCASSATTWYLDPEGTTPVGTSAGSSFPGDDYGVLRYFDSVNAPSEVAAGTQTYPITSAANPSVGSRICMPGLSTGLHCGTVTALNVSVTYPEATVTGLFATNLCLEPGEAGGPGFTGTTALGIAVGGQGSCATGGVTYFQPVTEVLSVYGLSIG